MNHRHAGWSNKTKKCVEHCKLCVVSCDLLEVDLVESFVGHWKGCEQEECGAVHGFSGFCKNQEGIGDFGRVIKHIPQGREREFLTLRGRDQATNNHLCTAFLELPERP